MLSTTEFRQAYDSGQNINIRIYYSIVTEFTVNLIAPPLLFMKNHCDTPDLSNWSSKLLINNSNNNNNNNNNNNIPYGDQD